MRVVVLLLNTDRRFKRLVVHVVFIELGSLRVSICWLLGIAESWERLHGKNEGMLPTFPQTWSLLRFPVTGGGGEDNNLYEGLGFDIGVSQLVIIY